MRALRQTQHMRKDFISFATTTNIDSLNPDILDERLFNSSFHHNPHSQLQSQRLSNTHSTANPSNYYSSAQLERMRQYIGRSQIKSPLVDKKSEGNNSSILQKVDKI